MSTKTIVPTLQVTPNKPVDETDELVYLPKSIVVLQDLTFELSGFENPSEYQRDFLQTGATMAAKYVCQTAINRWKSITTKAISNHKYQSVTVENLPAELCKRTEFRHAFEQAQKAKDILRKL